MYIKLNDKFKVVNEDYFRDRYGKTVKAFEASTVVKITGNCGDITMSDGFSISRWELENLSSAVLVKSQW